MIVRWNSVKKNFAKLQEETAKINLDKIDIHIYNNLKNIM